MKRMTWTGHYLLSLTIKKFGKEIMPESKYYILKLDSYEGDESSLEDLLSAWANNHFENEWEIS